MKITCIATAQVPSDTANSIQVMKTCQALRQLGHEIELLLPGSAQRPWETLAGRYGLTVPFPVRWLPARIQLRRYDFSLKAARLAGLAGADLVYTWTLQAALAGLIQGLPVVLEMHGPPEGLLGPRLFRWFLGRSGKKRIGLITRALQDILERDYGRLLNPREIVIAPNGVDLDQYADLPDADQARKQLEIHAKPVAGYTGHLYRGRGMDLLVELARRHPEVHFLWVGGRPADVAYWDGRLVGEAIQNIQLTGFVPNLELPRYQAVTDVLLMPYERVIEGSGGGNSAEYCSPMKMFEYLASGRAIISSDLAPLREVLDDETAVLCEPENADAWSNALSALIADPERARRLGAAARRKAEAYTWTARQEKLLDGFPGR